MQDEILQSLRQSIVDGAAQRAAALARQALAQGMDPLEAIERGYVPGMDHMGALYARREAFLPDLVMAGEAMKAAMAVLEPEIKKRGGVRHFRGRVVLGTVKGDIHEIGKNLVGILLTANGFEVHDLGVNVPAEAFVAKAREVKADLVGASALLTTTMSQQKNLVEAVRREELHPKVRVMVGGAAVTQRWVEEIAADGFSKDAVSAVALAKRLVGGGGEAP
jgi:corrinoid protein of di/trimethylamine methyltransferase